MSDSVKFGQWLQREREKRGWSQNELANRANIGRAIVNKTESGNNKPAPDTLIALAGALGYPVKRLYELVGYLPPDPESDPLTDEGVYILQGLEGEDLEEALRLLRLRREVAEERGKYSVRKRKTRPASAG